jgi:hypothetical protein
MQSALENAGTWARAERVNLVPAHESEEKDRSTVSRNRENEFLKHPLRRP